MDINCENQISEGNFRIIFRNNFVGTLRAYGHLITKKHPHEYF